MVVEGMKEGVLWTACPLAGVNTQLKRGLSTTCVTKAKLKRHVSVSRLWLPSIDTATKHNTLFPGRRRGGHYDFGRQSVCALYTDIS